jgi:hypothetical protein
MRRLLAFTSALTPDRPAAFCLSALGRGRVNGRVRSCCSRRVEESGGVPVCAPIESCVGDDESDSSATACHGFASTRIGIDVSSRRERVRRFDTGAVGERTARACSCSYAFDALTVSRSIVIRHHARARPHTRAVLDARCFPVVLLVLAYAARGNALTCAAPSPDASRLRHRVLGLKARRDGDSDGLDRGHHPPGTLEARASGAGGVRAATIFLWTLQSVRGAPLGNVPINVTWANLQPTDQPPAQRHKTGRSFLWLAFAPWAVLFHFCGSVLRPRRSYIECLTEDRGSEL